MVEACGRRVLLGVLLAGTLTAAASRPAQFLLPFQLEYDIRPAGSVGEPDGFEDVATPLGSDPLLPPDPYLTHPHLYKLVPSKRRYLGIELPDYIAKNNHGKLKEQMMSSGK
nr:uncharacterized protein LOC123768039 [Procambarus clarkii]